MHTRNRSPSVPSLMEGAVYLEVWHQSVGICGYALPLEPAPRTVLTRC